MSNGLLLHRIFIALMSLVYLFFIGWFLKLWLNGQTQGVENLWTNFYGIIPLAGGIYGLVISRHWGGLKSSVGRAVVFLSLGLVTWGIGIAIWIFYNLVLGTEVPYPSWADAGFILSWPLWGMGAVYLSRATGAQFGLKNKGGKLVLFIVPVVIIGFSYYFLVTVARGGILLDLSEWSLLKIFFDLAYPIGDIVILTLAMLVYGLSYKYFGGKYRYAIYLILLAFAFNYLADFTFSYTTTIESYYNGSLADALFATTMFTLSAGIAMLNPAVLRNKKENS
ncbi:MAG: hypothetical protein A3C50_02155 [Candidatus Staskawiczbacteria bacterium RIFCSPHIGHO2_02_FULL_43_16]|uniref:Uncharacterized protein n=1 Tax=Candidatus Staskawiczbacteria bacterium RIFCSPHIGHO2_01_FULL_41_41 TaxID=1802203 RepID=A0A1G2HW31_9BACT|nr:MAG: hypothetical protein A2822_00525 [Candidatus Staskawiczbacteria bacterium RIFCSPHIGHO2_01_FULL_41_41]OGZ68480.1 MAG: hypothetical protein A3C50_02155 [Candidatus Staskawiczbacteria bacterium RIFCSPHIGHO2_02_FULL_43_16]OGZ74284.1 MAG: hypothetical protein A3A12_02590 [Candidatus Staskawiczbacteria bacterium RIFCSPLOWO2_01_FULL_43_17b]